MFSQSDDEQQGWVLGLVFGLIVLVLALVLSVAISGVQGAGGASTFTSTPSTSTPSLSPLPPALAPAAVAAPQPAAAAVPAASSPSPAAAQAAADAASITVEYGVIKFYFASGKAELAAGASEALVDVVKGARGGKKVVISGFHDAKGNAARNAELAGQRALAVRNVLLAAGLSDSQIRLEKPAQTAGTGNDAEARRVEIELR